METFDMQTFITMTSRNILGQKFVDKENCLQIDSGIPLSFITTLSIPLGAGTVITLWTIFTNIHLKQTFGMTLRSKKEKNHFLDTVIQLLLSTQKCIFLEGSTLSKHVLMIFTHMTLRNDFGAKRL